MQGAKIDLKSHLSIILVPYISLFKKLNFQVFMLNFYTSFFLSFLSLYIIQASLDKYIFIMLIKKCSSMCDSLLHLMILLF